MEVTPMNSVHESIHNSIVSILNSPDASHPSYPTTYYLDPKSGVIRWYPQVENIIIDENWVRILTAHPRAIPKAIVNILLRIEDILVDNCLEFQLFGGWKDKPDYSLLRLEFNVTVFYPPEEWFDDFDRYDIRRMWRQGMSAEEIVSKFELRDDFNENVDRREALDWIKQMIQEWEKKKKLRKQVKSTTR